MEFPRGLSRAVESLAACRKVERSATSKFEDKFMRRRMTSKQVEPLPIERWKCVRSLVIRVFLMNERLTFDALLSCAALPREHIGTCTFHCQRYFLVCWEQLPGYCSLLTAIILSERGASNGGVLAGLQSLIGVTSTTMTRQLLRGVNDTRLGLKASQVGLFCFERLVMCTSSQGSSRNGQVAVGARP